MQTRHDSVFPWGTFLVNVMGCLVLGVMTGAVSAGAASSSVQLLVGTGFCGALSTYSTFSYETLRLAEDGAKFYATANVVAGVVTGLGAAYAGWPPPTRSGREPASRRARTPVCPQPPRPSRAPSSRGS